MSTVAERIPLAEAEQLAAEVVELLAPHCERIEVAGSIRRKRPTIGDLEIVCVPKFVVVSRDLFGAVNAEANVLDTRAAWLVEDGVFAHRRDVNGRPAFGERYKRLTYRGRGLDLFSVLPPAQWGVIFLIRTGSADFSHRLVTPKRQGGWMSSGMHIANGVLWRDTLAVPTPEELDVFCLLNRPYVEPERREV